MGLLPTSKIVKECQRGSGHLESETRDFSKRFRKAFVSVRRVPNREVHRKHLITLFKLSGYPSCNTQPGIEGRRHLQFGITQHSSSKPQRDARKSLNLFRVQMFDCHFAGLALPAPDAYRLCLMRIGSSAPVYYEFFSESRL